jgi:chorismate-pyruvate lyase
MTAFQPRGRKKATGPLRRAALSLAVLASGAPLAFGEDQRRAQIAALEADLLAQDSATAALNRLCAAGHLADPPVVRAVRVAGADKPADVKVRRLLGAAADEPIRYRRVDLTCGRHVLSSADNWYRPGRLTEAMNLALDRSDTPFGQAVRDLNFHRRTLEAQSLRAKDEVLRISAVLATPDERPFSLVVETYHADLLGLSPPVR